MSALDWAVLVGTLAFIGVYGVWKSRGIRDMEGYIRAGNTLKWPTIGLSIMATQASAITFLSTPGQAFEDGMRFVQFYFGLPLAMIVISAFFVPIYYRLNVYTAYEYLEHRFDVRVRYLGALLFLVQRGLAAGITLYAPSIILSSIFGWPLQPVIVAMGAMVIAYTVSGGSQAVSQTQKQQMMVMLAGMAIAGVVIAFRLPEQVSFPAAVGLAGALGRMNVVSFELDFGTRYNFWAGIAGGFFLALSYFGTDQSQVQRYLSGRSATESRLGLIFNGMFKVPMQFGILFIGVLVFVFHLFTQPPLYFDDAALRQAAAAGHGPALAELERRFGEAFAAQRAAAEAYVAARGSDQEPTAKERLRAAHAKANEIRKEARALVTRAVPELKAKETDYVFFSFVTRYLPPGLVGLLVAVILCAAMSSTSSELAALGSTAMIDLYRRSRPSSARGEEAARRDVRLSKLFTVAWGLIAVAFASFASMVDNLIEAVNILGSIFYGTVLGLFAVAFFFKRVTATPVFVAALIAQATVIVLFLATDLGFLWFNVVGCAIVVVLSIVLELVRSLTRPSTAAIWS